MRRTEDDEDKKLEREITKGKSKETRRKNKGRKRGGKKGN